MRYDGTIKSWNDDRGFGFIEPTQGGQELFVHIKAFSPRSGRPTINQMVSFEVELNREGKKRAKNVEFVRRSRAIGLRRKNPTSQWGTATLLVIPAFLVLYVVVAVLWKVPNVVAVTYIAMSIVCYFVYLIDKSAAKSIRRRTKESTLLLFGLLGGWPGGILAQQFLRHKSVKTAFRSAFWGTVVANIGAFVALSSPLVGAWRLLP